MNNSIIWTTSLYRFQQIANATNNDFNGSFSIPSIVPDSPINFITIGKKKSTWFRKVAWRQTSDRPLHETMFSIRSHTGNTPEGTVVMRSIIIQYGTQWLRAAGINRRVLTRDTHKSVRVGVSAVKFHQIILFLLFFIYMYCRIYTWWNSRLLHNKIVCQVYCNVCLSLLKTETLVWNVQTMKGIMYIQDHIDIDSSYVVIYSIWYVLSFVYILK